MGQAGGGQERGVRVVKFCLQVLQCGISQGHELLRDDHLGSLGCGGGITYWGEGIFLAFAVAFWALTGVHHCAGPLFRSDEEGGSLRCWGDIVPSGWDHHSQIRLFRGPAPRARGSLNSSSIMRLGGREGGKRVQFGGIYTSTSTPTAINGGNTGKRGIAAQVCQQPSVLEGGKKGGVGEKLMA